MSMEDFGNISDDELLESAQQGDEELKYRDRRPLRALGEYAVDSTEYTTTREETEPFLVPGSDEAKEYAREPGMSGRPRWMERFSRVDIFGRPTVFSDRFDPTDRGL